ncbi:MAG: alpha-hydroxy acid oxidase [Gammaproteobacteria bacterium]
MPDPALDRCISIEDLRRLARRRLPRVIFEAIESGADDEVTLRRNVGAFSRLAFRARYLVDVDNVDISTTVLGEKISVPIIVAPTALNRVYHPDGEVAVARAAAAAGTVFTLSAAASTSIEAIAGAPGALKWFQVYVWRDRGIVREAIARCRAHGYSALCVTVDVPVLGNRERDLRNGMRVPPRPRLGGAIDAALHPRWLWGYLRGARIDMPNLSGAVGVPAGESVRLSDVADTQTDPSLTWKDLEWIRDLWDGPLVVKGIQHPEDARIAASLGARAIVVSNHGGRQLDSSAATIDLLPAVVDAVAPDTEVLLDSGVRRGTDVLKAVALGARACLIGRPCLYGLGAAGEAGVTKTFDLLATEIRRDLSLIGCVAIDRLDRSFLI